MKLVLKKFIIMDYMFTNMEILVSEQTLHNICKRSFSKKQNLHQGLYGVQIYAFLDFYDLRNIFFYKYKLSNSHSHVHFYLLRNNI